MFHCSIVRALLLPIYVCVLRASVSMEVSTALSSPLCPPVSQRNDPFGFLSLDDHFPAFDAPHSPTYGMDSFSSFPNDFDNSMMYMNMPSESNLLSGSRPGSPLPPSAYASASPSVFDILPSPPLNASSSSSSSDMPGNPVMALVVSAFDIVPSHAVSATDEQLFHVPSVAHRAIEQKTRIFASPLPTATPFDRFMVQKLSSAPLTYASAIPSVVNKRLFSEFPDCTKHSEALLKKLAQPNTDVIPAVVAYIDDISSNLLQPPARDNYQWKIVRQFVEMAKQHLMDDVFRSCFLAIPRSYALSDDGEFFSIGDQVYRILICPARCVPRGLLMGAICQWAGYDNDFVGVARAHPCEATQPFEPASSFSFADQLSSYVTIVKDEALGITVVPLQLGALNMLMMMRTRHIAHQVCDPVARHRQYIERKDGSLVPLVPRELLKAHLEELWEQHQRLPVSISSTALPSSSATIQSKRKRKAGSRMDSLSPPKTARAAIKRREDPTDRALRRIAHNVSNVLNRHTFDRTHTRKLTDMVNQLKAVINAL